MLLEAIEAGDLLKAEQALLKGANVNVYSTGILAQLFVETIKKKVLWRFA